MSEVIVAGGGPAGLAAAIAARQAGFEVSLFDTARPPIDKACGEGIMPDGLAALQHLGVSLPAGQARAFRGIRFVDNRHSVGARFADGVGYGIRRELLHRLLTQHAAAVGVQMHWGKTVRGFCGSAVEVEGRRVAFDWLICADGQNSWLRRSSGLFPAAGARMRYGFRRHYQIAPWTDFVEVHWAEGGQMYVTPIAHDEVCVAFVTHDLGLRFDTALPQFAELAERLAEVHIVGPTRGAVTPSRSLRRIQSGRIALVGEAAGSVDAITGAGLSIAFRQALAIAAAIGANRLDQYQTAHQHITRVPRYMERLLLALDRRRQLRRRVLRALERQSDVFERMLAVHTGSCSMRQFGLRRAVRLGWNLIH